MDKDNEKLIITGGIIAAVYFLFGKPILEFLGIKEGKGTKDYNKFLTDPASPFNVDYWRNYYYLGVNTPANGRKPVTVEMVRRIEAARDNVFYAFGVFTDDEAKVYRAFKECKNKAEVSLMCYMFNGAYKKNLLSYLKYGQGNLPENGLSEQELENVFNIVNNLPTI